MPSLNRQHQPRQLVRHRLRLLRLQEANHSLEVALFRVRACLRRGALGARTRRCLRRHGKIERREPEEVAMTPIRSAQQQRFDSGCQPGLRRPCQRLISLPVH